MAKNILNQNLALGTGITTNKTKKINSSTGGLYADFIGNTGSAKNVTLPTINTGNVGYGDFINVATPSVNSKSGYVGAYTGEDTKLSSVTPAVSAVKTTPSYGYSDYIGEITNQPVLSTSLKNQVEIKKPDFASGVVGTVGGGFSGGNKGGVTDEGVIVGNPTVETMPAIKTSGGSSSSSKAATENADNFAPAIREIIENLYPEKKQSTAKYADFIDTSNQSVSAEKAEATTPTTTPATQAQAEETKAAETANTATAAAQAEESKSEDSKMSYEDYIAEMKKGYQEQLDAANKQAEQTKARAMANAENAYAQNKATYGTNAETLAQMGLTGGGYSDYLQAQAYAQKRADAQAATAQEIASKSNNQATYQQYIQAMNEKLADKILYDERLADQRKYQEEQTKAESDREYTKNIYNTLWSAVQDTNTTYTPESIKALGEKAGLSNEDITTLTNMLNATLARKTEEEKKTQEEEEKVKNEAFAKSSSAVAADTISYIVANNGGQSEYIESLKSNLTEEDYNKLVSQNQKSTSEYYTTAIKSGYNVNTNEIDNMYKKGNLSEAQYNKIKALWNESSIATDNSAFADGNGYTLSFKDAKTVMNTAKSSQWINDANKKAIESTYMRLYAKDIANEIMVKSSAKEKGGNVVDIYASDFNTKKFGSYSGMGKSGNTQEKYAQSIVSDAKSGKIKAGDYVIMNYGNTWDVECIYVYIGDGIFVKAKDGNDSTYLSGGKFASGVNFYVPNGYKINISSNIAFHVDKK